METFKILLSKAVPLLIDNIDTDMITPVGRIAEGGQALIDFAFEPLRFDQIGKRRPECPLNDPAYTGAKILITGENFACGSSRETAVWAVAGLGFRCVIAPSFGEIFYSSCFKNGLLPVRLSRTEIVDLAEYTQGGQDKMEVNLETQTITAGVQSFSFEVPSLRREALLLGLDDLALIQQRMGSILEFESKDRFLRPWVYFLAGNTYQLPDENSNSSF